MSVLKALPSKLKINKTQTQAQMNITLASIADYRNQLNALEQLIVNRDHIQARIQEIDNVLEGILDQVAKPTKKFRYVGTNTLVSSKSRHAGDSLAPRLQAACLKFPDGITLGELTEELGVAKITASAYVYSSRIGGKFLHRDYNQNGKPVWFFKHN
jgi:chaperonin cofactor prefoldin